MTEPSDALTDLRILVVEDEVMIMMMLEDFLEDFGCVVQTAPNIEKALELLHEDLPDGVLLDMNIQGRKPVAVIEELLSRSVPFLLVTGYGSGANDPATIKAAPRLQKPFDAQELRRRMTEVFVGNATGDAV